MNKVSKLRDRLVRQERKLAELEQGAPRAEIEKQEARIEATHAELAAEELRLLNGGKLRF